MPPNSIIYEPFVKFNNPFSFSLYYFALAAAEIKCKISRLLMSVFEMKTKENSLLYKEAMYIIIIQWKLFTL